MNEVKNSNVKIVFFGSSKYSLIGAKIIHENLGISLIVTVPNSPLEQFTSEENILYLTATKLTEEIIKQIALSKPDFLVVEDYGLILPNSLLKLPKFTSLNIHHSLLPKYRGPAPAPEAILAGEKVSGVSIIEMSNIVDGGDIYAQKEYTLRPDETTDSLLTELNNLGGQLAVSVIKQIKEGKAVKTKQDENKVIKTKFMQKTDGLVDISNIEFDQLDRKIRAYFPWPGVWTKVKLNPNSEAKIVKFLPNKKVQVEGKKEMSYKDFINGYPKADKLFLDFLRKAQGNG
jgi:methionyl-tRNA formyltransferase